ncbi:gamma-glutamylcyclotransferase [Malaciobacter mytili]|uniref:gamma-glutamylcyclotransferase n=1 Tax=Malaciobacter mytili TaxID=603050 RepID=UPI00100BE422|nr:gamma-glutamylcyclotransferase [Malaciobacter mytili]RXI45424.1 gamma-glutamylcyclotransferase [Malaciobacter mytili]
MYLFGYGSLINLNSAQKSFKRKLTQKDLIPVCVKGYKKVWNSIEIIKFEDNKDTKGVFLNLQIEENSLSTGVVIKITNEELELLKLREKNYSCITIKKESVLNIKLEEDIIAFMTTKEEKLAKSEDKECFIPAKYIDILTSAFTSYDKNFIEEYKKEVLKNFPFSIKEGTYSFSDPTQNKFAKEGINESK